MLVLGVLDAQTLHQHVDREFTGNRLIVVICVDCAEVGQAAKSVDAIINIAVCPVAVGTCLRGVALGIADDGSHLRDGDGVVWTELTAAVTGDQTALCHRLDGFVSPVCLRHIGELLLRCRCRDSGTFRNVPLLLSHACLCAGRFDAYVSVNPNRGCSPRRIKKIYGKIC